MDKILEIKSSIAVSLYMKNKENFSEDKITIKIIKTDIWFAKKGLSPFQNPTNDEAKFNIGYN